MDKNLVFDTSVLVRASHASGGDMRHLLRVLTESDECVCWIAEATLRELTSAQGIGIADDLEVLEERGPVAQKAADLRLRFPSATISDADILITATTVLLDGFLFTHNESDFPCFTERFCVSPDDRRVTFQDAVPGIRDADKRPQELALLWRLSERAWPASVGRAAV